MDEIKRLQNILPTLRACANWSVQEFAEMLGVTRQTINNLEKVDGGTEMSKIQYLAIRSLFSYEIEKNNNKKLSDLLYYLVDHPEKLNQEKQANAIPTSKSTVFLLLKVGLQQLMSMTFGLLS